MKLVARYLAPQMAESFCMEEVALWYNTQSVRNLELDEYKIHQIFNQTRHAAYAKLYPLKLKAGVRGRLTWEEHPGHYVARDNVQTWRLPTVGTEFQTYRYYMKLHNTRYQTPFPLVGVECVTMFIVYRLDAFANQNHEENYLMASSSVAYETERGICFTPSKFAVSGKTSIRIHGVKNYIGHQEFSDWGVLADPTKLGVWNVIGVHWDVRPGHTSSVWFNYGKDYKGGKMFTFKAATAKKGEYIMVGNTSSRFSGGALDGALANIEIYDTTNVDDHVIGARMRYLSDYYNVCDTIYT